MSCPSGFLFGVTVLRCCKEIGGHQGMHEAELPMRGASQPMTLRWEDHESVEETVPVEVNLECGGSVAGASMGRVVIRVGEYVYPCTMATDDQEELEAQLRETRAAIMWRDHG